jgi:hypothetical protein
MARLDFTMLILLPLSVAVMGVYLAFDALLLPDWTTPLAVGEFIEGGVALVLGTTGVVLNSRNRQHQRLPALEHFS